jgi:hypothetical protein
VRFAAPVAMTEVYWLLNIPKEWYDTVCVIKFFFSFGATAPIWTLAYLYETLRFASGYNSYCPYIIELIIIILYDIKDEACGTVSNFF